MRHASTILQGRFYKQKIPPPISLHGHMYVTPQKIKEAAFQLIHNRQSDASKIIFWDLFCGSGQMGYEALSRSFLQVIFCERDSARIAGIHKWLGAHQIEEPEAKVFCMDALKAIKKAFLLPPLSGTESENKILIFYADPPYTIMRKENNAFFSLAQAYKEWQAQGLYKKSFLMVQAPSSILKSRENKDAGEHENTNLSLSSLYTNIYTYGHNMLLTID